MGAKNVFSGVTQGIPNARLTDLATAIDNLVVPGSSALANRTSVGSEIVSYHGSNGGAIIVAADTAGSAIVQATQYSGFTGMGYAEAPDLGADVKYNRIINYDDISLMAEQTGVPEEVLVQVKQHLFIREHNISIAEPGSPSGNKVVKANFSPSMGIADTWIAARRGFSNSTDEAAQKMFSRLIPHEYIESKLMEAGIPFISAHPEAWKTGSYLATPKHFGAHNLSVGGNTGKSHFAHWKSQLDLSSDGLTLPEDPSMLTKEHLDSVVRSILERVKGRNFY
jgi:hypothetical protein